MGLLFLLLACDDKAPDDTADDTAGETGWDPASNLCGTLDRSSGAPPASAIYVVSVLDGKVPCAGGDTGGGAWWGEVVAEPAAQGDRFQATVPPDLYGVEVYTSSDYTGCAAAEVVDESTCSADIVVVLDENVPVDKPNVYLYPTEPTEVAVRLPAWRRITESEPRYPVDGWRVTARPDGLLHTPVGPRDYLFYEMNYDLRALQTEEGWCVDGALAQLSIEDAMADLGFLPSEVADFAEAWDDAFPEWPTMTVYPQFEGLTPLRIDPEPDALLRAWFLVSAGCRPVAAPAFPVVERVGFHAAEWGIAFEAPLQRPEIMILGG